MIRFVRNVSECTDVKDIDEDVLDHFTDKVKELVDKYKYIAIRYTTSAFLRLKLGQQLDKKDGSHVSKKEKEKLM